MLNGTKWCSLVTVVKEAGLANFNQNRENSAEIERNSMKRNFQQTFKFSLFTYWVATGRGSESLGRFGFRRL
jgi:hypothetical protein